MMDLLLLCLHIIILPFFSSGNIISFSQHIERDVTEVGLQDDISKNESLVVKHRSTRKATLNPDRLWPGGIIPYIIQAPAAKDSILESLKIWEVKTCLRFVSYNEETEKSLGHSHRISFFPGNGCSSSIGSKRSGEQIISIGKKCANVLTVLHELGHAIGLHHEQERADRDKHVRVLWLNIQENVAYNFDKRSTLTSTPYDYNSIMHYKRNSFSVNSNPTVVSRDPLLQYDVGPTNGVTFYDAMMVNRMYSCNKDCAYKECKNNGYVGPYPYCSCICPPGFTGLLCEKTEELHQENKCRYKLTDSTGTLSSPNYPEAYSNKGDCLWYIEAKPGQKIRLSFKTFSLEDSRNCKRDFVSVRTKNMYEDNHERMCGFKYQKYFISDKNKMLVGFKSDYTFQSTGFLATYRIYDEDPATVDYSNCLGRSCYTFIDKQLAWHEADNLCQLMGGNLPVISSAEENEFIRLRFGERSIGRLFWIGMAYMNHRDRWQWIRNEYTSFNGWTKYTQPTKFDTGCVVVSVYGKWNNIKCNRRSISTICETYVSRTVQANWQKWEEWESCSVTCNGGTQKRTRQCNLPGFCHGSSVEMRSCNLQICAGSRALNKPATQSSTLSDASLAVDGNFWARTFVKGACSRTRHQWEPWWKVDLGKTLLVNKLTITKKGYFSGPLVGAIIRIGNESNAFRSNRKCNVGLTRSDLDSKHQVTQNCRHSRLGRYVSIQLEKKHGTIELCEVQVYATDCHMFDGRCYFLVKSKRNFKDSQKECHSKGAVLASIDSIAENKHMQSISSGWSFLNIRYSKRKRGWYSHLNGALSTFQNWAAQEPIMSNRRPKHKCVSMKPNGRWRTWPCTSLQQSVCETL
ncbi:zinc metalloproteinase nas-37-like [Antedon mediterranea]|uniref:zinc metalloproteinase nas-37-like n=1 Tax=Antedon mediterranea TaxID=105859 RepID=UPI003AF46048